MTWDEIWRELWGDQPRWKIELWCNATRAMGLLREFTLRCFEDGKFDQGRRLIRLTRKIGQAQDDLLLESSTVH